MTGHFIIAACKSQLGRVEADADGDRFHGFKRLFDFMCTAVFKDMK